VQPGAECTFEPVCGQCLPRAHECFLGEVLGSRTVVTDQPRDHAVHAPDMAAVQRLERADIAPRRRSHQCVVTVFRREVRGGPGGRSGHGGGEHSQSDALPGPTV